MSNKKIRRTLFLFVICMVFVVGITLSKAEIQVDIETTSNASSLTEDKREFYMTHSVDVSYVLTSGVPEVVLVLDRSNSMLEEGYDGVPVAQTVRESVDLFINRYFDEYEDGQGQVAVVSFGTNAVKNDNWKYYDNRADALNEVDNIYAYDYGMESIYEYIWKNNHWLKNFVRTDYTFYWLNWNHENGGTNMKEAFEYAEKTIWAKDKQREPHELMPNSVILFSDGVSTHGGDKSEEDLLYPVVHNSNTINAIEAATSLDEVSNIITVGYFEAIKDSDVARIARATLTQSQNGGFFEAKKLDDIELVFQSAQKGIKYVGTDSYVIEDVEPEFYVNPDGIEPAGATLIPLSNGGTRIKWDIGTLKPEVYEFSYYFNTKPNKLPTGGNGIVVNPNSLLTYNDLYDDPVTQELDSVSVDVGPLEGVASVDLSITQLGKVGDGYLTGDDIELVHRLSYTNTDDYKFEAVILNELAKEAKTAIVNPFHVTSNDWSLNGTRVITDVDTALTAEIYGEYLSWDDTFSLNIVADKPGDFLFEHELDYQQIDASGQSYDGYFDPTPDTIKVKESNVSIMITDSIGLPVSGAQIYLDGVVLDGIETDSNGEANIIGLKSGTYSIGVKIPSSYTYKGTKNVYQGVVNDMVYLDYENPTDLVGLTFDNIPVKDVIVEAADGSDYKDINDSESGVEAYVRFTTGIDYRYVELKLQDDHSDPTYLDSEFDLDRVEDAMGNVLAGFSFNEVSKSLIYDGSVSATDLTMGTYKAYGTFTIPETLVYPDDFTFINVDTIYVQQDGDPLRTALRNIFSDGLTIRCDEIGPEITIDSPQLILPTEEGIITVEIQDEASEITRYVVLKGKYRTEEEVLDRIAELSISGSSGLMNVVDYTEKHLIGEFEVQSPQDDIGDAFFEDGGDYTVYAVDALGNGTVENTKINAMKNYVDNL